ncbi:MAG: ATP-binding protein [Gemmatimonas sp.]
MKTVGAVPSGRTLILAPKGRDAAVAATMLLEAGIEAKICTSLPDLCRCLGDDVALAVVTEEAVRSADLRGLIAWVAAQPSWSDLPFILLTDRAGDSDTNPAALRLAEALGNITFLERPFRPATFISLAKTALKGRRRQYEARARLDELREGEERLQTALKAGRLGPWELDLTTWILTASDDCKANFGRRPDHSFTYGDLLASVHPDDRALMQSRLERSIATGADYALEYRNIWPDGGTHWIDVRARAVKGPSGKVVRLVGVTSDITGRKTAEDTLRTVNERLEERVKERTAELERAHRLVLEQMAERSRAEEQLRQAQKLETIGQLTGGVAHDFNNLLMAVLANLDLLRKHLPNDPKVLRLIDTARQGAQRGASLTQRLLAFARRQELDIRPVDLVRLLHGMMDLLARSVGPRIEIKVTAPATLAPAMADANQVELAVLNLILNARDAMPGGGVVTVRLDGISAAGEDGIAAGRYARLTVIDSGCGMDAETLKRAIDPFFSTKELGKGTGLGLSMVHGLAVQLNGALRLSSEPGRGTVAELWLPAAVAEAVTEPEPPAQTAHATPTRPATILVVDDDALVAMSTAGMLEDLGHRVIEVNSASSALAILREGEPVDLLVTDHAMPGMTGIELAKAARALRPNLPVLLATGYADLPKGAEIDLPRLSKPYQQEQLADHIGKLLRPLDGALKGAQAALPFMDS